jgi:single-stranded-DNA-specific exonuclease
MQDIIEKLLVNRGIDIKNKEEIDNFLNPDFQKGIFDPYLFVNMNKAVDRLHAAIKNQEKILIYTDYDCDGIPAATIFYDFFKKMEKNSGVKINFENYIPHRHKEGYGLHQNVIERYISNGFTLMITADLGITNVKEIDFAEKNGMNVILTDHHLPLHMKTEDDKTEKEEKSIKEILPPAFAVINTQVSYEKYPNKNICGAATAWKLVNAFLMKYRDEFGVVEGWEKWLLDMVALATVADLMPLTGENRVLVHYGLEVIRKNKRPALNALLKKDKVNIKDITETDLSFSVAPKINAASRLGHPITAFYALSNNEDNFEYYVKELENLNNTRKQTVKEINSTVLSDVKIIKDKIIFLGNTSWPLGVVGLVAQKIVEETGKTTFVWGMGEDGLIRGSSRSGRDNVNVTDLTASAKEYIVHFGGHEAAGGFAFSKENIDKVKETLNINYEMFVNVTQETQKDESKTEIISIGEKNKSKVEVFLSPEQVNSNLLMSFRKLAPFGIGNPAPICQISGNVINAREFGKNKEHIELNVGGLSAIKFFIKDNEKDILKNGKVFIGSIEKDNWSGKIRLRLI